MPFISRLKDRLLEVKLLRAIKDVKLSKFVQAWTSEVKQKSGPWNFSIYGCFPSAMKSKEIITDP